jgi:hypothetical protein
MLEPGRTREVALKLEPVSGELGAGWVSADDHIHLTRSLEDDRVFLRWLEADDLSVGNFLQLQRQMDAAVQYAFGREGEAVTQGRAIRPGQESRSEYYGHVNLLGPAKLVRPVSVGTMYSNEAGAYPCPSVLFAQGRSLGAAVGYAHFDGSMKHSTLLMDLALGGVDFIEVFQFGVLKAEPWYELLNAGFRVTGVAGSDFPANLAKFKRWPRAVPLLGPERTLVKADEATLAGRSVFDVWIEKVRKGEAVVSNGPLLDLAVDGRGPGAVMSWEGGSKTIRGEARAVFYRPLEEIEIVVNGKIAASKLGDGQATSIRLPFDIRLTDSVWVAARVKSRRLENEPEIQAHSNPVYALRGRRPVQIKASRYAVVNRWRREADYYRSAELPFATPAQRRELEAKIEETTRVLNSAPPTWLSD